MEQFAQRPSKQTATSQDVGCMLFNTLYVHVCNQGYGVDSALQPSTCMYTSSVLYTNKSFQMGIKTRCTLHKCSNHCSCFFREFPPLFVTLSFFFWRRIAFPPHTYTYFPTSIIAPETIPKIEIEIHLSPYVHTRDGILALDLGVRRIP